MLQEARMSLCVVGCFAFAISASLLNGANSISFTNMSLAELILLMQVALLLLLYNAISQIHTKLLMLSSMKPIAAAATGLAAVTSMPTELAQQQHATPPSVDRPIEEDIRSRTEVRVPNWEPATESQLLSEKELQVMQKLQNWLGSERLALAPRDLLVCFLRGYSYRVDWAEASCAFLDSCLTWRRKLSADTICLLEPPPKRHLWEELMQSAPVGYDTEGHVVIMERPGAVPVSKLVHHFNEGEIMMQQCYTREALRMYSTANCIRRQARTYKCVTILDFAGFSFEHKKFIPLMRDMNKTFGYYYPETISKFYAINVPFIFRAIWNAMKVFLHPITVQKFHLLGSNYLTEFTKAGIVLPGDFPAKLPGWAAEVEKLKAQYDLAKLARGYMPLEDEQALKQL